MINRPREARQNSLNLGKRWPHIALRNHRAFKIKRVSLCSKANREVIYFVAIKHPPSQLGRLAKRNRQHASRQRIECTPVPDLDLGIAALTQRPLDSAHALR